MMSINLWFDREAEEAADFYTSVLRRARKGRVTHYLDPDPTPSNRPGEVLTVEWEAEGMRFIGLNGGTQFTFNEAVSFGVYRDTQEEIDEVWNALTDGGHEGQCGWCTDRFGVSWQVIPSGFDDMFFGPDEAGARRVTEAMLQMRKLDIAQLEAAYAGTRVHAPVR
ncbi:MAG: 3-demethylubiquinone-9 3-methyltransferase [Thermoleophilia bacterium]|nr:3-demethylubiquinone-9 3-methyltransferase [Thermoleophilia bacterium]